MTRARSAEAAGTFPRRFGGLARRLFLAFLAATVIPTGIAGITGVYFSVDTLRQETLRNLSQEVGVRASGLGRFFDRLTSELHYLTSSGALADLLRAKAAGDAVIWADATQRLEREYAAFATFYPHIYQLRFLDAAGWERVRVDRAGDQIRMVPPGRLQDKSDRYYFQEAMRLPSGGLYVVERSQGANQPENDYGMNVETPQSLGRTCNEVDPATDAAGQRACARAQWVRGGNPVDHSALLDADRAHRDGGGFGQR